MATNRTSQLKNAAFKGDGGVVLGMIIEFALYLDGDLHTDSMNLNGNPITAPLWALLFTLLPLND